MPSPSARRSVLTSQQAASKQIEAPPKSIDSREPLLTARQASEFLQVPVSTLAVWRSTGRVQLAYVKLGGAVRYRSEDIARFLAGDRDQAPPQTPRLRNAPSPVVSLPSGELPWKFRSMSKKVDAWSTEHGELACYRCGTFEAPGDAWIVLAAERPGISLPAGTTPYCLCKACNVLGYGY